MLAMKNSSLSPYSILRHVFFPFLARGGVDLKSSQPIGGRIGRGAHNTTAMSLFDSPAIKCARERLDSLPTPKETCQAIDDLLRLLPDGYPSFVAREDLVDFCKRLVKKEKHRDQAISTIKLIARGLNRDLTGAIDLCDGDFEDLCTFVADSLPINVDLNPDGTVGSIDCVSSNPEFVNVIYGTIHCVLNVRKDAAGVGVFGDIKPDVLRSIITAFKNPDEFRTDVLVGVCPHLERHLEWLLAQEEDKASDKAAQLLGKLEEAKTRKRLAEEAVSRQHAEFMKAKQAFAEVRQALAAKREHQPETDEATIQRKRQRSVDAGNKLMAEVDVIESFVTGKPLCPTPQQLRDAFKALGEHGFVDGFDRFMSQFEDSFAAQCTTQGCQNNGTTIYNKDAVCPACGKESPYLHRGEWDDYDGCSSPRQLLERIENGPDNLSSVVRKTRKAIQTRYNLV